MVGPRPDHARHHAVSILVGLQSSWTVSRGNLDVNGQRVDMWEPYLQATRAWGFKEAARTTAVLRLPGVRLEVLEAMVLLGDAQPAGTDS